MPARSSSPSAVLRAVTDADLPARRLTATESITLLQALASVPDPRAARGRRHALSSILMLAVGAVLAGATSYAAIADWAAEAEHDLIVCGPTPHTATFARVLGAVDPIALEAALTRWMLDRRPAATDLAEGQRPAAEHREVIAVDGKTLRGAHTGAGAQIQLAAVFDHGCGLTLTQAAIAGGDEIAAFTAVLNTLPDLAGVLITADALHTQRAHADYLLGREPTT